MNNLHRELAPISDAAWSEIEEETSRTIKRYLAGRRVKRAREVVTDVLPEQPVEPPAPELRMVVLEALAALPPGGRAVVVLRYWEDLSVEQTAAFLGCSPGNVKSQAARALSRLRAHLGDELAGLSGQPGRD